MKTFFQQKEKRKKLEVLSMLCNIKSLTSRCLKIGCRDCWISVSQKHDRGRNEINFQKRFNVNPFDSIRRV